MKSWNEKEIPKFDNKSVHDEREQYLKFGQNGRKIANSLTAHSSKFDPKTFHFRTSQDNSKIQISGERGRYCKVF